MSEEGIFDDEYRGVGGTFVIDPTTGKRVPACAEEQSDAAGRPEDEDMAKQEQATKPRAKATATAADTQQGA